MRIVCQEQEVVLPDGVDEVLDPLVLEPEGGVDVVPEVLRGASLELLGCVGGHLVEIPFGGLHGEGYPATTALHRHDLQLRIAVKDTAMDEVQNRGGRVRVGEGGEDRHFLHEAEGRPGERIHRGKGGKSGADVEVHGQLKVVDQLPERLPVGLAEIRQVKRTRPVGDGNASQVELFLYPPDLLQAGVQIPEREHRLREEPVVRLPLPIGAGVVVDFHALDAQLRILDVQEGESPEAARIRVHDLGVDAHAVHELYAGLDFIDCLVHLLEGS